MQDVIEGERVELSMLPPETADIVRALIGGHNAECWRLHTNLITDAYLPGDMLIVDMAQEPRAGDIVLAMSHGALTQPLFRLFYPPRLMVVVPWKTDREPEYVDNLKIIIRGVVVASHRQR